MFFGWYLIYFFDRALVLCPIAKQVLMVPNTRAEQGQKTGLWTCIVIYSKIIAGKRFSFNFYLDRLSRHLLECISSLSFACTAKFLILYMVMSQHWKMLHLARFKADCWRNVARRRCDASVTWYKMRINCPEVGRAKCSLRSVNYLNKSWLTLLNMTLSRTSAFKSPRLRWASTSLTSHRFWSQVCHFYIPDVPYPHHRRAQSKFYAGRTAAWSGRPYHFLHRLRRFIF